jgi:hypothetical protein
MPNHGSCCLHLQRAPVPFHHVEPTLRAPSIDLFQALSLTAFA